MLVGLILAGVIIGVTVTMGGRDRPEEDNHSVVVVTAPPSSDSDSAQPLGPLPTPPTAPQPLGTPGFLGASPVVPSAPTSPLPGATKPSATPGGPKPPPPAAQAGYSRLTLSDEFTSSSTVDVAGTGKPGFTWYTDQPFGWPAPRAEVKVANSTLTILPRADDSINWSLSTVSPKTNAGQGFTFAYFEARMRFSNPPQPKTRGWPSFWSIGRKMVVQRAHIRYAELDFFEVADNNSFIGSVHDWSPKAGTDFQFNDSMNRATARDPHKYDFTPWHVFGCLWQPGRVRWYLDDKQLIEQRYSLSGVPVPNAEGHPVGTYSILDQEQMMVILGTAKNWPLQVDWVRVWQR